MKQPFSPTSTTTPIPATERSAETSTQAAESGVADSFGTVDYTWCWVSGFAFIGAVVAACLIYYCLNARADVRRSDTELATFKSFIDPVEDLDDHETVFQGPLPLRDRSDSVESTPGAPFGSCSSLDGNSYVRDNNYDADTEDSN